MLAVGVAATPHPFLLLAIPAPDDFLRYGVVCSKRDEYDRTGLRPVGSITGRNQHLIFGIEHVAKHDDLPPVEMFVVETPVRSHLSHNERCHCICILDVKRLPVEGRVVDSIAVWCFPSDHGVVSAGRGFLRNPARWQRECGFCRWSAERRLSLAITLVWIAFLGE